MAAGALPGRTPSHRTDGFDRPLCDPFFLFLLSSSPCLALTWACTTVVRLTIADRVVVAIFVFLPSCVRVVSVKVVVALVGGLRYTQGRARASRNQPV